MARKTKIVAEAVETAAARQPAPKIDLGAVLDRQKKNAELFAEARGIALQGTSHLLDRHQEMIRQSMFRPTAADIRLREPVHLPPPPPCASAHDALLNRALHEGFTATRELVAAVTQSQHQAAVAYHQRMADRIEEIRRTLPQWGASTERRTG